MPTHPPAPQLLVRALGHVLGQGEGTFETGALGIGGGLQRAPEGRDEIGCVTKGDDSDGCGFRNRLNRLMGAPFPGSPGSHIS
ncbi:hypothetical protein RM717_25070 [Streptomyces griseus]|uniref:Uncharacterized protein n=1 Tax=Streptomyces stephensoniae TaxID=3375367 RepID=A0ABU2W7C4_9ACTN|nr:hypothetical protein [Streptomyces griseus]MDT0493778.1 hypothetical protein [Streptomyces griseus]